MGRRHNSFHWRDQTHTPSVSSRHLAFTAASWLRGHAGPLRCVWQFAQKRDAWSPAACVTACAEIRKVISSFEFENSISSTRICNEFRFFDPRLTSLVIGHYMMSFTLLHFAWNRTNHCGGTCSQLMSQVGGGKTGNRLWWSIPL